MNIFLVTSVPVVPPWDQGDKNLAYDLARALPQHRFRILTASEQASPEGDNLATEPLYRRRHPSLSEKANVYLQFLSRSTPYSTIPASWRSPDLYHLVYQPYPLSSWLGRFLPEFRRRPTVHTVPTTASGGPLARSLFFADKVVSVSEHGRQELQALGLDNVTHIPPGIQINRWYALRDQADQLKARIGLGGHPTVLFPGHYGIGQGADVMLDALPDLVSEVPGVRVLFACRPRSPDDQERERQIREGVDAMGLTENVRYYGRVSDMETLIGASDLVALPLQTMQNKLDIPTTLLEALAAGKPIVISDLPPMSELIAGTNGQPTPAHEVGLLVPPGDAKAVAQALATLFTDQRLRNHMGQTGQALAQAHFDIQQVARRYEQLYKEMVH